MKHKTRRSSSVLPAMLLFLLASLLPAAVTPPLAVPPVATVQDGKVTVTFVAPRMTDVAVSIQDTKGRVVRHLAAGRLGPNPPPPLQANALRQSLQWDGKDDDGRRVAPGDYSARIRIGLQAGEPRALDWDPKRIGKIHGLALNRDGDLVVMSEVGRDSMDGRIQLFSADGEYLQTLLPRPASISIERAVPLGEAVLENGERFPTALLPEYGGRRYQQPLVTAEGDLVLSNSPNPGGHPEAKRFRSVEWRQRIPKRLLRIAADGGAPKAGHLGPKLPSAYIKGLVYLAEGPEKQIYISGADHAVLRVTWGSEEEPESFVGTPGKPGAGPAGLKDAAAIAFDAKGILYVADRGNHRVAAFDRDGKWIGEIPVRWPRHLAVHPKNGTIYVTSGYRNVELLKFRDIRTPGPLAKLNLHAEWPFLALDPKATPPRLYIANMGLPGAPKGTQDELLVRLVDDGAKLRIDKVLSDDDPPRQPLLYGVDRERELVYGNWTFEGWWRMDGRSGKVETFDTLMAPKSNGILEIGGGGNIIVHVAHQMGRLDHNLRPLPFSALGSYMAELPAEDGLRSYYGRDVCLAPNGDIYWIHERGGYGQPMRCSALNADGTLKKDSLITFESGSPAGVRADRQGNIYVVDHLKPLDQLVPDALEDVARKRRKDLFMHHYGSLLKFKPDGGAVRLVNKGRASRLDLEPGQVQFTAADGQGNFVAEGLEWSFFGVSMIRPARPRSGCQCWTPRFDVDDHGRVFVPDELRCRVIVLDANGNEITTFGRYGNVDDASPGVPLADPRTVMVSRKAAYVGDTTNQRVMRVPLRYEVTASCQITLPGDPLSPSKAFEKVRREALQRSPYLESHIDWDRLAHEADAKGVDELRAAICMRCRALPDWPQKEIKALYSRYLLSRAEPLRAAVVWSLWGAGTGGDTGRDLLRDALNDKSEVVRAAAAMTLAYRDDPSGLPVLFDTVLSKNRDAYRLAETAILKRVIANDPDDPRAYLVDDRKAIVPRFDLGPKDVDALVRVLKATRPTGKRGSYVSWYLRRATLFMLGLSKSPEAAEALLEELRDVPLKGNNLNRFVGALGVLRHRPAVPDLVEFVKRGYAPGWRGGHGDRAEVFAATALGRIAAPESVGPLVELLDSTKRGVAEQSMRALTAMFYPAYPEDGRLIPKGNELNLTRIDRLPEPAERREAWDTFWKANKEHCAWNPKGAPPLRR